MIWVLLWDKAWHISLGPLYKEVLGGKISTQFRSFLSYSTQSVPLSLSHTLFLSSLKLLKPATASLSALWYPLNEITSTVFVRRKRSQSCPPLAPPPHRPPHTAIFSGQLRRSSSWNSVKRPSPDSIRCSESEYDVYFAKFKAFPNEQRAFIKFKCMSLPSWPMYSKSFFALLDMYWSWNRF